jgi:vitamin B12 transporter
LRNTLLYIAILFTIPLNGQPSILNDTIKINEVVISGKKNDPDPVGYKIIRMDTTLLKNYTHSSLADLLSESSNIFIKSYGMGGTATPSFRGTGASQTQVAWNNININSPMLGQSDLALIPAGLIDDIQIYYGGASMTLNNGGIGGIINLETKPIWKNQTLISLNPGIGSFGQYTGLVKVISGNNNFQTVTKAYWQSAENNFRYLNTEISSIPVWEIRKNSQVKQKGFIQELYLKKNRNISSFRIWYQTADRNLPGSMVTQQVNSNEKQFDESLRTMLNLDRVKGNISYFFTASWILNRLNYSNSLVSIDSRNLSNMLILKAGLENKIGKYTKLKIGLDNEVSIIKSNNYNNKPTRNIASFTTSIERNGDSRLSELILVREIVDNDKLLIPDFSASLQLRLTDEKEYFLKANISRNSKIPTMNDLFWFPGGNRDLKNEYALIYELTYEMKQEISTPLSMKYSLSVFHNDIKDMILWHPGLYSYWTADNIENVNSEGIESSVALEYKMGDFISRLSSGYSFTKASTYGSNDNNYTSNGKQLIYIPENQVNASLWIGYKKFYSSWGSILTGKRFITEDNSDYLPWYFLNNFKTGVKVNLKANSIDISFNIDNIFGTDYQAIEYYPLPGRSYSLKFLFQIIK